MRKSIRARAASATVALSFIIASAVSPIVASAQPMSPNDDVWNAEVITGTSGVVNGNTTGATVQVGEPQVEEDNSYNTVWFSWVAPTSGWVEFDTCLYRESGWDTTMSVLTITDPSAGFASADNYLVLATGDDGWGDVGPNGLWCDNSPVRATASLVVLQVRRGVTYYIQVGGYFEHSMGSFDLRWTMGGSRAAVLALCDVGRSPRSSTRGCPPDRGRR